MITTTELIIEEIKSTYIDCPNCEYIEDPQYLCEFCDCIGGGGQINILTFIQDNNSLFENK